MNDIMDAVPIDKYFELFKPVFEHIIKSTGR